VGCIVEGDEEGVIADAGIAVDAAEDGGSEVGSIPGGEGRAEALAELGADGLGDERRGHLPEANIKVEGAGALPAESLIGVEEFLDRPALGIVNSQVDDLVAIARSEEGLIGESLGIFTGALDELAVGAFGVLLEVKGRDDGGWPIPPSAVETLAAGWLAGKPSALGCCAWELRDRRGSARLESGRVLACSVRYRPRPGVGNLLPGSRCGRRGEAGEGSSASPSGKRRRVKSRGVDGFRRRGRRKW
jgi:hypothetical protein